MKRSGYEYKLLCVIIRKVYSLHVIFIKLYMFIVINFLVTILHRGIYMSAHAFSNYLNELGKSAKCEAYRAVITFRNELIKSIIQEHKC